MSWAGHVARITRRRAKRMSRRRRKTTKSMSRMRRGMHIGNQWGNKQERDHW
jgi:hypothetical protein